MLDFICFEALRAAKKLFGGTKIEIAIFVINTKMQSKELNYNAFKLLKILKQKAKATPKV